MTICMNARPITVLLVDDQPEVLDVHRLFLIQTGCTVLSARNGYEAFEIFEIFEQQQRAIDLVITDYDMPEWNGMQLIRAIRKQHAVAPILMITGFAEDNIAKEARSYGVDILRKPVRFQTLAAIIRQISPAHQCEEIEKNTASGNGLFCFPNRIMRFITKSNSNGL